MMEQMELCFSQGVGYIGSRVKCTVDVEDLRRRMVRVSLPGVFIHGPWLRFGDVGTVIEIKPFGIFDRGMRPEEIPHVIVRFDRDGTQRFMAPDMLEVLV